MQPQRESQLLSPQVICVATAAPTAALSWGAESIRKLSLLRVKPDFRRFMISFLLFQAGAPDSTRNLRQRNFDECEPTTATLVGRSPRPTHQLRHFSRPVNSAAELRHASVRETLTHW